MLSSLYIGRLRFRTDKRVFGILKPDRLQHVYILGKTGTGKSSLIETMARQDLAARRGFALIDPHGDLAARLARLPGAAERLVYLNVPDPKQPFGYNPLNRSLA